MCSDSRALRDQSTVVPGLRKMWVQDRRGAAAKDSTLGLVGQTNGSSCLKKGPFILFPRLIWLTTAVSPQNGVTYCSASCLQCMALGQCINVMDLARTDYADCPGFKLPELLSCIECLCLFVQKAMYDRMIDDQRAQAQSRKYRDGINQLTRIVSRNEFSLSQHADSTLNPVRLWTPRTNRPASFFRMWLWISLHLPTYDLDKRKGCRGNMAMYVSLPFWPPRHQIYLKHVDFCFDWLDISKI